MSLEFIEDGHRYLLGEKEIPSVSEIIRFMAREVYGEADKFAMDQAADRGTRVHRAAEEIDRTGRCECDSDIAGYVNAYAKFLSEHQVEWIDIEKPVYNEASWYAGTLDRAGYIDGKPVILDIKTTKKITGKNKLLYAAQLTAYRAAYDGHDDSDLFILQLKDDGTYKLIKLEEKSTLFISCLLLHKEFEKTKRRKTNGRKSNG